MQSTKAARPKTAPAPSSTPPTEDSFWSRNTDYIVPGAILIVGIGALIPLMV